LKPGLQCRLAAAFLLEAGQCKFDVLASAQFVGGEIRTRAEIITDARPANGDAVAIVVLRIGDFEFGEDWVAAEVLEREILIRPNCRRSSICQSSSDMFSGLYSRDSLAALRASFFFFFPVVCCCFSRDSVRAGINAMAVSP
jgi:hypothetical protein